MSEIDYLVGSVIASKPDFDEYYLALHYQFPKEFEVRYEVVTSFYDYSKDMLSLSTKIDVYILPDGVKKRVLTLRVLSLFQFLNTTMLRRGATKKAIAALQRCYDLAQAHAYGKYCHLADQDNLPPMSLMNSPGELTEPKILAFLRKFDTVSKN